MFKVNEDNEGANAIGSFFDGLSTGDTSPPETQISSNAPLELMKAYLLADLTAKDTLAAITTMFIDREDLIDWIHKLPPIQDTSDLGVVTYYIRVNFTEIIFSVCETLKKAAGSFGMSSSLFQYKKIRLDGAGKSTKLLPAFKKLAKKQPYAGVNPKVAKVIGSARADIMDASVSDSVNYLGYDSLDDLLDSLLTDKMAGRDRNIGNLLLSHAPDQVVAAACGLILLSVTRALEGLTYAANGIKYKMIIGHEPDSLHDPAFQYHFEQISITKSNVCVAINSACYLLGFAFWLIVNLLSTRVCISMFGRPACEQILALLREHMAQSITVTDSLTQGRVEAILFSSGSEDPDYMEGSSEGPWEDREEEDEEEGEEDAGVGGISLDKSTGLKGWPDGAWYEVEDEDEDGDGDGDGDGDESGDDDKGSDKGAGDDEDVD